MGIRLAFQEILLIARNGDNVRKGKREKRNEEKGRKGKNRQGKGGYWQLQKGWGPSQILLI